MSGPLLDANVLIALTVAEHEHHARARAWLADVEEFAVCPAVEGALVRFLIRLGESCATARAVLSGIRSHPRCGFWPDAVSYLDVDLGSVRGHRQVADAYLAGLARARGGSIATFDGGFAQAHPDVAVLVP